MGSYYRLTYHGIFSTAGREPWIRPEWKGRLFEYAHGIVAGLDGDLLISNGVEDHVHLLFALRPRTPVSELIQKVKANSSRWVNREIAPRKTFRWQKGYAAFSVGSDEVARVSRYISGQEEHHRGESYPVEMRRLLEQYNVDYEEDYLWE